MEEKWYTLPLAPQDLVAIYREKEAESDEGKEYVLNVDYDSTVEKLNDAHILIYLANTNFKTAFNKITPTLIQEWIKSNFLVNCPMLSRVYTMILRKYLDHDLTPLEVTLSEMLFSEEQMDEFIELNGNLIEDTITATQSMFPFILYKLHEGIGAGKEENLDEFVKDIEITDYQTNVGPNIAILATEAIDAIYLIFHKRGINQTFNKAIYNDSPKYFGKDLYYSFCQSRITEQIKDMLPEGFWNDSSSE